ncbi:T9SS type A sorting domain-containing protein [Dyadobacter sp. 676]|uniref:T9SS type A sorting domain-containing protein n=1 Tax=Dyadobacter sp. 676 TaxID=3088362 RepID=A0AAU8FGQ3_9BACT
MGPVMINESTGLLSWSTSDEVNSDRFEVQRSRDGKNWLLIGNVASRGERNSVQHYEFIDLAPMEAENFYRLKMIDKDGSFTYSAIHHFEFRRTELSIAYPNPALGRIFIRNSSQMHKAVVFDIYGRLVIQANRLSEPLDVRRLSPGLYLLYVDYINGERHTQRIWVGSK